MAAALAITVSGCLSSRTPDPTDAGRYRLAADTLVDPDCHIFTSLRGLWVDGLDKVQCLTGLANQPPPPVGGGYPAAPPPTVTLRKGSTVRIVRVFTLNAVDATGTYAELMVTEPGSSATRRVYSYSWPADRDRYLVGDAGR